MALFDNKQTTSAVVPAPKENVKKPNSLINNNEGKIVIDSTNTVSEETNDTAINVQPDMPILTKGTNKKGTASKKAEQVNEKPVTPKKEENTGFGKSEDDEDVNKIVNKYDGVDFSRVSKEKCFRVINELLITIKRFQSNIDKSESENLTFYNKAEKINADKDILFKQITFLARKLSPSYNKFSIENKEINLTANQIINMILEDTLVEKKNLLEQIKTLREEKMKDKELLEELKKQLSEKLSSNFFEEEQNEKSEYTTDEIKEIVTTKDETVNVSENTSPTKMVIVGIDLEETRNALSDIEYDAITFMGKTGTSLYPEILKYLLDKGYTESKVKTAFAKLEQYKVVNSDLVKTAKIKRGVKIYELSQEIGSLLYKEKTGLKPVESERSHVIRDHDNLVHGYSILETAKVLEVLGYLDITVDRKVNQIAIGDGKYYIPDIIALNPVTKSKEYFEVEFGNHNNMNFSEKLTKANLIARTLRFVVPSEVIKNNLLNKINHWRADPISKKSTMKISVATITELENKNFGIEIN